MRISEKGDGYSGTVPRLAEVGQNVKPNQRHLVIELQNSATATFPGLEREAPAPNIIQPKGQSDRVRVSRSGAKLLLRI